MNKLVKENYQIQSHNPNGRITTETKERIIQMLLSGEFPIDSEIARACDVSVGTIQAMIKSDPELAEARKQSQIEMAQMLERSHVDLAINGRNEIARQKALEFLSRKLMPERYGDNAEKNNVSQAQKKVVINLTLPEVSVDADGIPIANSKSPLEEEQKAIDV